MSENHWMVFSTFAEQNYYVYPKKSTYRGVVVNANMVAWKPTGIAAFLAEKTASSTKYLVNPLTHAFQHDPNVLLNKNGKPKSAMLKLAKHYGPLVEETIGKRSLSPRDFEQTEVLHDFVQNCIAFQVDLLANKMRSSNTSKYMDNVDEEVTPFAVVAPYFYLSENSLNQWLPINVAATEKTIMTVRGDHKCYVAIVISKGLMLDENLRNKVVASFKDLSVAGFLVWIDDFDEHAATEFELRAFLEMCRLLRDNDRCEVLNLHGGYFSVLASSSITNRVLTGVAHGPEFGEHRPIIPVGGGIPVSKYYIPHLHARVRFNDAAQIFAKKNWLNEVPNFLSNVCNCEVCRNTLANNIENFVRFGESTTRPVKQRNSVVRREYPTTNATLLCLRHYLQCKNREYEAADSRSPEALLADLEEGIEKLQGVDDQERTSHLARWKHVLETTNF